MITKEELQERAQLVRIHEANCQIEHPTEMELAFRLAIMRKLAMEYQLPPRREAQAGVPARADRVNR